MNDILSALMQIGTLVKSHAWVPVAAVVINLLVRVTKDDALVAKIPITVQPRWRSWFAVGLGVLSGVLDAVVGGDTWPVAIMGGIVSALTAISGHELVVEGVRKGRDLGVPKTSPAPDPAP